MVRLCSILLLTGCAGAVPSARPAAYEADLVVCHTRAKSLYESIACENEVRARYGRPKRPFPDAGAP